MGKRTIQANQLEKQRRKKLFKWLIPLLLIVVAAIATVVIFIFTSGGSGEGTDHSAHEGHNDAKKMEKEKPAIVKPYWKLLKSPPVTSEPLALNFRFADRDSGVVITDYETYHEKKMHVIVISTDFKDFYHYHPELAPDGMFTLTADLKRPANYKIITDARSKSKGWINESAGVLVRDPQVVANHKDPKTPPPNPPMEAPKLIVNDKETLTIDGKKINLKASNLKVGEEAKLEFTFTDATTGKPITNLEPYLGSIGHVILARPDLVSRQTQDKKEIKEWDVANYTHTHALNDKEKGPKATFSAVFDAPGKYKLWGEFKHAGKRFVVHYVIEVKN
jgi:hypothetical protein